jgi:phosphoribosylamine--glycine ligase
MLLKVLVVGNGAREHALAWKIARSPLIHELYVAPGNAGTSTIATNCAVQPDDFEGLFSNVEQNNIDLTIIGPEAPLAKGIVDFFNGKGLPIVGPSQQATKIESSKVFAKKLMTKYGIPCAAGMTFSDYAEARKYVEAQEMPVVVKADGLAAGKGVIIAATKEEAFKALSDIMETKIFGSAGEQVIIEECLQGKEVSLLAFTDGTTVLPMIPACDYKRIYDNDGGPNTGGMGSYSPPGFFDCTMIENVSNTIIKPVINAMASEGSPYTGVIYCGLMITGEGPRVLEFNARFGDPETQVILPRLKTDIVEIFLAIQKGQLDTMNIEWSNDACIGVVVASGGYPGKYQTGFPISGLNKLNNDIIVFHAGTKFDESNRVITSGGRVLTVTTTGNNLAEARDKVYKNIPNIRFTDCYYRTDIAAREVN